MLRLVARAVLVRVVRGVSVIADIVLVVLVIVVIVIVVLVLAILVDINIGGIVLVFYCCSGSCS